MLTSLESPSIIWGMDKTPLEEAIAIYGTQKAFADILDCDPMAVYRWKENGVPANRCVQIERVTNGKVTRQDLRPDLFGLEALK